MKFKTIDELYAHNKKMLDENGLNSIFYNHSEADYENLSYFERITINSQPHEVFNTDWSTYYSLDFANTFLPRPDQIYGKGYYFFDGAEILNGFEKTKLKLLPIEDNNKLINLIVYSFPKEVEASLKKDRVQSNYNEICLFIEIDEKKNTDITLKYGSYFKSFLNKNKIYIDENRVYKSNFDDIQKYFDKKLTHENLMSFVFKTLDIDSGLAYGNTNKGKFETYLKEKNIQGFVYKNICDSNIHFAIQGTIINGWLELIRIAPSLITDITEINIDNTESTLLLKQNNVWSKTILFIPKFDDVCNDINSPVTDNEINHIQRAVKNEIEERKAGKYFAKGWWTDTENKPIKEARILDVVRFHVQTQNIENPKGKKINIKLYEYDTPIFISLGFKVIEARPFDDRVRIIRNSEEVTEIELDENGKGVIGIKLNWELHSMFKATLINNFAEMGKLEFYFECSYQNEKVRLPVNKSNYLAVYQSAQNLFIKPAIDDKNYFLPEILSRSGEIILFLIEKGKADFSTFATIKVRITTTSKLLSKINEHKKTIYIEKIDLDRNVVLKDFSYEVTEASQFMKIRNDITRIDINSQTYEVPKNLKDYINVYDIKNGALLGVQKVAKAIDNLNIIGDFKSMIPELSSNGKFNMPSISTFVGFIPGGGVLAMGLAVIEWVVQDAYKEFKDAIDEQNKLKLEYAKMKGLDAIRLLLQNVWFKEDYQLIERVPQPTVEKLLKGKIKTLEELQNETLKELETYNEMEEKTFYSLIIKITQDPLINDKIFTIETIINEND